MNQREKLLLMALLFAALLTIISVMGWLFIDNSHQTSLQENYAKNDSQMKTLRKFATLTALAAENKFSTPDPMSLLNKFATQTAEALNNTPTPTATLLPDTKYWYPLSADGFAPRLTYNSKQWAATDIRTLASLQISGCVLRLAGGRALGPGWTTEESTLKTENQLFSSILAKRDGVPQFITYSLPNGAVFEIASESDFAQCQQSGEAVLKTITIQ